MNVIGKLMTKAKSDAAPRPRNSVRSQEIIVDAAQKEFSAHGYSAVGIRDVSNLAAVNQNLITRYFGGKLGLFEKALANMLELDEMFISDREKFGENMARLLHENDTRTVRSGRMMALSIGDPQAQQVSKAVMEERILGPISEWMGAPAARSRAWMVALLSMGYTVLRVLTDNDGEQPSYDEEVVMKWLTKVLQDIAELPEGSADPR